jgi:hypothetical protein
MLFNFRFIFSFVFVFFMVENTNAQNFSATASIDTNAMLIGKQVKLTLQLTHPKNQKISWVDLPDTIGKIEIVEKSKIDTSFSKDSASVIRTQQLVLTAFDSGYYVIPPFHFVDASNPDTSKNFAETQPLLLTVNSIPVDTTKAIKDIKAPVEVPYTIMDFLPYIIGLLLLAIVVTAIIVLMKHFRKKPVIAVREKPKRPAHEIAIEELKKLQEEKLWQKGDFKSYHTNLTDIIRNYLWHRYDINAMEMTTDEILENHIINHLDQKIFSELKYMLELADFVKFAKVIPAANENEQSLSNAFDFVHATKLVEMKEPEKKEAATP